MLLDSNIIIYAAEPGYDRVRQFVAEIDPVVSIISKVEVLGYHKLSPENSEKLETLFSLLPVLPVTDDVIELAISLRQQRRMSLGDALIAGTALSYGLPIVTANVKDYEWVEGLEIINPLEV